ncbi:MAG TPA: FecR family protein, partial [Chitinophagaceae bacterium]|nr:FecR family protein [Chitinophagaceae bacterium]
MSDDFSIEELIIDDSFVNYCFQSNQTDILFWEDYVKANPAQKETIEEAMRIVLGLHVMLQKEQDEQNEKQAVLKSVSPSVNKPVIKKIIRYAAAVAAAFVLIIGIKSYLGWKGSTSNQTKDIATTTTTENSVLEFSTAKGEKKTFFLPDNTKLYLGAGSTLRMEKGFGKNNRAVYLTGEALFDVTHNKDLPFIVHCDKYDVKVLGTLFNVRAYPEDELSETSLIRGKVEISLKNNANKITLNPDQKAIINNKADKLVLENNKQQAGQADEKITVSPLSYSTIDSAVVETAWIRGRLEIVNESFEDIRNKLERWYNVKI